MRNTLLVLIVLLFANFSFAQKATISGTVSDSENGETLIGAFVEEMYTGKGTTTNEYGFYSLSFDKGGPVNLEFTYVGFEAKTIQFELRRDTVINIELGSGVLLNEVVVKSESFREQLNSTEMSVETLTPKEAKVIPALFGEVDIIKTIQLKPGISSGSEGSSGLYVRGGGNDQNLIALDEALVYNANHLFGFFSTFNADAIKDVKIYKGGFPAQYGGRLSSVIDVKLKEGNQKKFAGSGGIGLISSRLTLEGPIIKDKSSFMVSGRRTYVDLITRQINRANDGNEDFNPIPDYYFYDLNAKVNYTLSDKDRLFLSGYFGRDVFGFDGDFFDFDFDWGNATGTARWNHVFNARLFANTTFTYSDYQYNIANRVTGFSFDLGSQVRDANLKTDFYYALNDKHTIRFGAQGTYHAFTVGRLKAGSDDGEISFSAGEDFDGTEMAVYGSDEIVFNERLKVNAGLRLSGFVNDGEFFYGIEPRLSSKYSLNERLSLKGSYARMYQYVHLVSNSAIALPTDIWYPSTELVRPQVSDQIAVGGSFQLAPDILLTNEYFYKWLDNQVDFKDHAQLFANDQLEQEFAFGDGYAYGMEVGIEKTEGRLTGWIGYTLSYIRRGNFTLAQGGQIMDGRYFPPRHDRRHDLSVVGIYELNKRLTLTGSFVYGSGDISWLPSGRFFFQDVDGANSFPAVPVYGDRNSFRLPAYHRLDLGMVIRFFPKWGESNLTISVYNAYDRRNPYLLFLEPEFEDVLGPEGNVVGEALVGVAAKQVSLFPVLPSLTWNFEF
jgi:hypothetical protein